jgi:hypothetical protein
VLFSSDEVANFINEHFEPVWESVRPVPMVTIDFGNGHKITRTLNGNIATHACNSDGTVLDILPGVYTPDKYRQQLEQLLLLHRYSLAAGPNRLSLRLKDYHDKQAARLEKKEPVNVLMVVSGGPSILAVESTVRLVARGGTNRAAARAASTPNPPAEQLAGWKELAEDTRINETIRRLQIHKKLAQLGNVKPTDVTKWLYKEVLHADLDDPYLGLREILDKQNPFASEDGARPK